MATSNIVTPSNINNAGTYIPTSSISYEQFYQAFQQALSQTSTWSVLQDAGVGSQLLSNLAALGVSCEYYTERRLQEAFIETAQSPVSIYEGVNLLGGSIQGVVPAQAVVVASNSSSSVTIVLEKYTTLSINGGVFYLTQQITVPPSSSVTYIVVEGEPTVTTVQSSGAENQVFYVSSNYKCNNFLNVQVQATTNSPLLLWSPVQNLWLEGSERFINPIDNAVVNTPLPVYQSQVYPNGQCAVYFGDGANGQIPKGSIQITSYQASGGAYNLAGVLPVTILTYEGVNTQAELASNLTMETTTAGVFGGAPQKPASTYKTNPSLVFAANDRFVTASDFQAGAVDFTIGTAYPVKGCRALGERDLYPGNAALANTVVLILLMYQADYNSNFLNLFSDYMSKNGVFSIISPSLAQAVTFNTFNVVITMRNANLTKTQILNNIQVVLTNLVGAYLSSTTSGIVNIDNATSDLLGATWDISDFYKAIIPVIADNAVTINYNYNGITDNFTLEYAQYLYLDFINGVSITFV